MGALMTVNLSLCCPVFQSFFKIGETLCVKWGQVLNALDSVSEATVNLDENRADVRYDSGSVKIEELIAVIEEAGYNASAL